MAAAESPRSIQQNPLLNNNSALPHSKPFNSSPPSSPATPTSLHSDLHHASSSPSFLLKSKENSRSPPASPSAPTSSDIHALHNIRNISIPLTHQLPTTHSIPDPTSPVSVSNTSQVDQQHLLSNSTDQPWISTLLATKFYGPCAKHSNLRKNDLNLFCTLHAEKICQYCNHNSHSRSSSSSPPCTILHVSRYMYHDVLLAKEASALLDISDVQSYLNNGNRVVYIDRRAQPKSKLAPHAKACEVCSRTLQDPYRFCSVFCRLAYAKDPAAVATLPVPDATPLVNNQTPRKAKSPSTPSLSTPTKKIDRSTKRYDRHSTNRSMPTLSGTPQRSGHRDCAKFVPSLQLVAMKKRNRRKACPFRSPPMSPESVVLYHDFDMS